MHQTGTNSLMQVRLKAKARRVRLKMRATLTRYLAAIWAASLLLMLPLALMPLERGLWYFTSTFYQYYQLLANSCIIMIYYPLYSVGFAQWPARVKGCVGVLVSSVVASFALVALVDALKIKLDSFYLSIREFRGDFR